jgi:acylpyruvate hydrolase
MLFMKATSSYIVEGEAIKVPHGCKNLSQEVELAVVMGQRASNVAKADAMSYVGGYAVALDMTARDFQVSRRYTCARSALFDILQYKI